MILIRLKCSKVVYPFHDGAYEDFEPIFNHLIQVNTSPLPPFSPPSFRPPLTPAQNNINDGTSTEYTEAFFPIAEALTAKGDAALASGDPTAASALYLRACTVYRIARFPYITAFPEINNTPKWAAWEAQKRVYTKAASTWSIPLEEIDVPHVHAKGADRPTIPVYVRAPKAAGKSPAVILMTGLDGYRPDNTVRCEEFLARGWAAVVVEIPGTADCPADSADPESPDRLWSSLLDWMEKEGRFEMGQVLVWGLSSGGYYAIRIAHTHRERLVGSIAQGAGCHYFYDREWLEKADGHEYPFQ